MRKKFQMKRILIFSKFQTKKMIQSKKRQNSLNWEENWFIEKTEKVKSSQDFGEIFRNCFEFRHRKARF